MILDNPNPKCAKAKTNRIYLRLNDRQTETIQKKADKLGMSIGIYLRFLGLNVDLDVNKFVRQKTDRGL